MLYASQTEEFRTQGPGNQANKALSDPGTGPWNSGDGLGDGLAGALSAADIGSQRGQFAAQLLVPPAHVVHAGDFAGSPGGQRRDDDGGSSPDVDRLDRRAREIRDAIHDGGITLYMDIGAHAPQFVHVAESRLKDRLTDPRLTVRPAHQRDERRGESAGGTPVGGRGPRAAPPGPPAAPPHPPRSPPAAAAPPLAHSPLRT